MSWSIRALVAFALAAWSTPFVLAADGPITEADAVRLFVETSPRALAIPLIEESISASLRVEAQVANPTVAYQIEDAAGVREEFLTFQQQLPITGRRGLVRDGAEAASRSAGLAARRDLTVDIHGLRSLFHEVLYRERDLERLNSGTQRLDRVVEILRRREVEGEASTYDRLRAEQELAELGVDMAGARARLASARSRFGSFFDADLRMERVALEGDLGVAGPIPDADSAVERAWLVRLDLKALAAAEEQHEIERRTVVRRRFPEPTLTAGWKRTGASGLEDTGFIAALALPLPIFNRGQVGVARATANRERARLNGERLRREIRGEVLAALEYERAAREVAERFGQEIQQRAGELRTIAQLRYDEGEGTILELLDAHRTALAMESRALTALYESRRAEIERERVTGSEVTP